MIDAIVRAEKVHEEFVFAVDDCRFGQAIVIAVQNDAVALAGGVIKIDAVDHQMIAFGDDG